MLTVIADIVMLAAFAAVFSYLRLIRVREERARDERAQRSADRRAAEDVQRQWRKVERALMLDGLAARWAVAQPGLAADYARAARVAWARVGSGWPAPRLGGATGAVRAPVRLGLGDDAAVERVDVGEGGEHERRRSGGC
jgi:hypothetical protein